MTFDLKRVAESKRALRRRLAAMPIGDKLRLLDVLRERQLALQRATALVPPIHPDGVQQGHTRGPGGEPPSPACDQDGSHDDE